MSCLRQGVCLFVFRLPPQRGVVKIKKLLDIFCCCVFDISRSPSGVKTVLLFCSRTLAIGIALNRTWTPYDQLRVEGFNHIFRACCMCTCISAILVKRSSAFPYLFVVLVAVIECGLFRYLRVAKSWQKEPPATRRKKQNVRASTWLIYLRTTYLLVAELWNRVDGGRHI